MNHTRRLFCADESYRTPSCSIYWIEITQGIQLLLINLQDTYLQHSLLRNYTRHSFVAQESYSIPFCRIYCSGITEDAYLQHLLLRNHTGHLIQHLLLRNHTRHLFAAFIAPESYMKPICSIHCSVIIQDTYLQHLLARTIS